MSRLVPSDLSGSGFLREREIFLEALEQPTEEARAAYIEAAVKGDLKLKSAVEALISTHLREGDDFLAATKFPRHFSDTVGERNSLLSLTNDEKIGDRIDRYKLLEVIGEGGCGVVYLAEQQEPVRRRVALKVIKLGMDTRSVVARFEAERQALALMDHPNIARVFDGGVTATGRPYFVMELVRGVRITDYCSAHRLSLKERLDLFIQLCHAIQHAHQKGIIHRDIKPSNVLVTAPDGRALPKVIDFGIAKAIEEPLTDKTVFTTFHAFIGTPAYTSPEQAEMTGADVDTRSDIYSLGVLLYELLAGVTPFDPKELTRSGLDEMRRIIREREPERPSTRVNLPSQRPRSSDASRKTGSDQPLDPDLDWIIMKCLEKDRSRRFSTAQELAADLQRYINQEPVTARPPSRIYLAKKLLRRHRPTVAAAGAVLTALLIGATLSLWQAVRATRAEHVAEKSRAREASLRGKAEHEREKALENQRRAEINEYIADVNLAEQALNAGNLARATELLKKHKASGKGSGPSFEWRYLWHLAQGDERSVLAKEESSVLSLAASPDGKLLAVGLREGIDLFDLNSSERVRKIAKGGMSLAFSPSGLLAGAAFRRVHLWRTSDWVEILSLPGHAGPLAFSADGSLLAMGNRSGIQILGSSDGNDREVAVGLLPPFAFSPAGSRLVANSADGLVIWDLISGEQRGLEESNSLRYFGWVQEKQVLQFSPDGKLVAAAHMAPESRFVLEVWDVETGKHLGSLPSVRDGTGHSGLISGLAFSPDSKWVATSSWDHSLRLWELAGKKLVGTYLGNVSEVWSLAFASSGRNLISGAKDGTVAVWPVTRTEKNIIPGGWRLLAVSENGDMLITMGRGRMVSFLNMQTGRTEREVTLPDFMDGRGPFFVEPQLSRDLRFLALPLENGVHLMDLTSLKAEEFLIPEGRVDSISLSPSGDSLVAGSRRGVSHWWNTRGSTETSKQIRAERAIFTRDGRRLFTFNRDGFQIWDAGSRQVITNHTAEFPARFSVALSPDGEILAAGSDPQDVENAIYLLNTRTGKAMGVCAGHTQGVGRLAFSPDGKTLASTSTDGTLRLWNVLTQQQLLAFQPGPVHELIFSPDGSMLVAETRAGLRLFSSPITPGSD